MQLYLVQHGASKSEEEDPQRGLTADGRRVVEAVARHLTNMDVSAVRIEHSGDPDRLDVNNDLADNGEQFCRR